MFLRFRWMASWGLLGPLGACFAVHAAQCLAVLLGTCLRPHYPGRERRGMRRIVRALVVLITRGPFRPWGLESDVYAMGRYPGGELLGEYMAGETDEVSLFKRFIAPGANKW